MLNEPADKLPSSDSPAPPPTASQTITNWLVPTALLLEIIGRAMTILAG
ncbi:hypothetical protein [Streptomyces katrae]|nr:hypothetical protein [Streptomyces katrae]